MSFLSSKSRPTNPNNNINNHDVGTSNYLCVNPDLAFNSEHPGGADFAMCDGSVRFISETIEFSLGGKSTNLGADWSGCTNCWVETALDPPGFPQNLGIYQLLGLYEDGVPISNF